MLNLQIKREGVCWDIRQEKGTKETCSLEQLRSLASTEARIKWNIKIQHLVNYRTTGFQLKTSMTLVVKNSPAEEEKSVP